MSLAPFNPPLGINQAYCVPKQTVLKMKEKVFSLSGDTFHITDEHNQEVVQCRGQAFSLSGRKEFADSSGRPLFSLRHKHLSIHKSFYAEDAAGNVIFEVKQKFSIGSSKMIATFTNASNGQPIELFIKGDWLARSANISLGNTAVATISRNFLNARELLGGQQSYYVTVAPGVDLALLAAICVCLDECTSEN